jgi:hypothetical protein
MAKRMATQGTRPNRSISVDPERGRAWGPVTAARTVSTDTHVALGHPYSTGIVLFPSEEGFQRL